MGRRKFDKKTAQTFNVVHRSHEDSLYFDNDASRHVLVPANKRDAKTTESAVSAEPKIFTPAELQERFSAAEIKSMRENEGLAAQYGIFFDDSNYDYMQHLKPIGKTSDAVFIEATAEKPVKKNINDLLKENLPSEKTRKVTHDVLENIPRELQGFNPEMDPRLREVLEALEDEAYIEGEDAEEGDIFADLLEGGEVEDEDDFYYGSEGEYDEWDLDNYEEEYGQYDLDNATVQLENAYNEGEAPEELETGVQNTTWEKDFFKYKSATKNTVNDWDSDDEFEEEGEAADVLPDLPAIGGKKKKNRTRKKMGAMTDTTSFSMTSSALFRSEGLTLLDDRYEQLMKKFEQDDEPQAPAEFNMKEERLDFEGLLDDFLDNYEFERGGRKLMKRDDRLKSYQEAADSVSKSKTAARRKKEKAAMEALGGSFGNLGL